MRSVLLSLFVGLLFLGALPAVGASSAYIAQNINLAITPEFPAAGEKVTITLTSYSTDLNRATMVWRENGEIVSSGIGQKIFSTTSPASGQMKAVSVSITTVDGTATEKNITLSPQDVDLLVESLDGYTPPFYKGRSLPVREGLVKVSAIPHVRSVSNSKDAVYTWEQNHNPLAAFSGYGKRYLVYKNAFLDQTDTISVTASAQMGTAAGKRTKVVSLYKPKTFFYEDHPSEGVRFNKAISGTFSLTDSEVTFLAVPYFSSTATYHDAKSANLDYIWRINGTRTIPTEKNKITLRKPEGGEGKARLGIEVTNLQSTFQKGDGSEININF